MLYACSGLFASHFLFDTVGEPVALTSQRLRRFAQGWDEVAGWAARGPPIQPPHPRKQVFCSVVAAHPATTEQNKRAAQREAVRERGSPAVSCS